MEIVIIAVSIGLIIIAFLAGRASSVRELRKMLDKFEELYNEHFKMAVTKSQQVTLLAFVTECLLEVWTIPANNTNSKDLDVLREQLKSLKSIQKIIGEIENELG